MDLNIVIVSYNTRELLADCLSTLLEGLACSSLRGDIWVVDNGSIDGSPDLVRQQFARDEVHLIAHDANLGFAAGNNLALAHFFTQSVGAGPIVIEGDPACPTPRHVLFLNPDTRTVGDALGTMVRFLDLNPRVGAVGARLVHGDGSFQHSAFRFPGLAQIFLDLFPLHHRVLDSRLNGRYPRRLYAGNQPFQVDHPLGAALMVRAETLAQVGGFDEQFFMYCEEIDLCRRIKAAGWKIYCVPQAEIVHLVGQSTGQVSNQMFVALWRSRFLMYQKHNSAAFVWTARSLVRLGLAAKRRRALSEHRRGHITGPELERRLAALEEVAGL